MPVAGRVRLARQVRPFFTVVPQYQRGVRLGFGKYVGMVEPGIRLKIPFYHQIHKMDTRDFVMDIPKQSLISMDNVTYYVDASVQYKVVDVYKAVLNTSELSHNLMERVKGEIRDALSAKEINEILHNRGNMSERILKELKSVEDGWGIKIEKVQLRDIAFDDSMKKAMAIKAEADRNAEAKVINARADVETAKQYHEASKIYGENPLTMRLREFQLWNSVSKNPGSTIVVVPSNIVDLLASRGAGTATGKD